MKRTILALAIAGLSVAAYASPPPGGGPPMPIDVNVTNPLPLPTTEVPSLTSPGQLFFTGMGGPAQGPTSGIIPLVEDVALQSYDAWVQAEDGVEGTCELNAVIEDKDFNFVAALGPVAALNGRSAMLSVRLPNVQVLASQDLHVKVTLSSPTLCIFGVQLRGVKVP
jgi:hypothetical protein